MMQKVKYIGHFVSEEGKETDKVLYMTTEKPEEMSQFIGFIGYFRRVIPNFIKITTP